MRPEDIIEARKRWNEYKINYEKEHPEQYESSYNLDEWIRTQQAQGKIIDPFIENWLNSEIATARRILIIGMLLTVLIKGQIVIWAIMYWAYRCRVKKVTEEAIAADRNKSNR